MPKFDDDTIARWKAMAQNYLSLHADMTTNSVETGRMAWDVAHGCGIVREAYNDRSVVDAHVQTALQKIMPNAVFRDKKRY